MPSIFSKLTLGLAFWSSSMEVAAFTVAPGARPQCTAVRAAAPEMWLVPTAATVGVVGTVIATKKALKLIPKVRAIEQATTNNTSSHTVACVPSRALRRRSLRT